MKYGTYSIYQNDGKYYTGNLEKNYDLFSYFYTIQLTFYSLRERNSLKSSDY